VYTHIACIIGIFENISSKKFLLNNIAAYIKLMREGKVRLTKPVATASDENYVRYAEQFDPAGDRRLLANEILRLRAMLRALSIDPVQTPVEKAKAADSVDDALI
jgi:hypothetical protein